MFLNRFRGLSGQVSRLPYGAYGFVASLELLSGSLAEAGALLFQQLVGECGVLLTLLNPTLFGCSSSLTGL